jgi:hypothetical protein
LPKAELPAKLTETKWGRCAILKDASPTRIGWCLPWSFDPAMRIALAPGISAFSRGREYDHGGLSPRNRWCPSCGQAQRPVAGQPRVASVTLEHAQDDLLGHGERCAGLSCERGTSGNDWRSRKHRHAEGKGRVVFEEVDDLIGEQISVVLRAMARRWPRNA